MKYDNLNQPRFNATMMGCIDGAVVTNEALLRNASESRGDS